MKAIHYIIALTVLLGLHCQSCASKPVFPDELQTVKTDRHQRVEGTRLYIAPAEGYHYNPTLLAYWRDKKTYLQVKDFDGKSFAQTRSALKSAIAKYGVEAEYDLQDFKFNGYDALCARGGDGQGGKQLVVVFGDSSFTTEVDAIYKDEDGLRGLLSMLMTMHYEKDVSVDPLELVGFTFDASPSGFKYATSMSGALFYIPSTAADLSFDKLSMTTQFTIRSAPPMTMDDAEQFLKRSLSVLRSNNMIKEVSVLDKHMRTYNGHEGFEANYTGTGADGTAFISSTIVITGEAGSVVVMAMDADGGRYMEGIKKTAETIKLK